MKPSIPCRIAIVACLVCSGLAWAQRDNRPPRSPQQQYSIEQAISQQAQLHTIAFSGLAFVTGDAGAATFLPPGKVCDFFGFQYMRDIDAQQKGHNPMFLNRVAGNVLKTLNDEQRQQLATLAQKQAPQLTEVAKMRWPMIQAFYRQMSGPIPAGSKGLNREVVLQQVEAIFAKDAELSFERAEMYGKIAGSLTPVQKDYFSKMKFGDFSSWPEVDSNPYRMPRGTEKMVNVAYMTYASEFFSWYGGSVDADVYFCPERHATYFGGFYMKDMPAMGKRDFDISTSVTGDSGRAFVELLTPEQSALVTAIPVNHRDTIKRIVDIRRQISVELRKFLAGSSADKAKVLDLGRAYGRLDGAISYDCAMAFAEIGKTMTARQRDQAMELRDLKGYTSAPAYVYSDPMRTAPERAASELYFSAPTHKDGPSK